MIGFPMDIDGIVAAKRLQRRTPCMRHWDLLRGPFRSSIVDRSSPLRRRDTARALSDSALIAIDYRGLSQRDLFAIRGTKPLQTMSGSLKITDDRCSKDRVMLYDHRQSSQR